MPGPSRSRQGPGIHPRPLSRVRCQKSSPRHPPKRQNLATRAPRPPPHGAPHDRTHRRRPPLPRGERVRADLRPRGRAGADRAFRCRRLPPRARSHVPRPSARGGPRRVGAVRGRRPVVRRGHARRPLRPGRPLHARHHRPRRHLDGPRGRLDRRVPFRPRRPRGGHRQARPPRHRDRLAHHHRGRLRHRRCHRRLRSARRGHPRRPRGLRLPPQRHGPADRGPASAAGCRHPGVHGHVVRQHPGQRPRRPRRPPGLRGAPRCGAGRLDRRERDVPELDGRPHHAGHHG